MMEQVKLSGFGMSIANGLRLKGWERDFLTWRPNTWYYVMGDRVIAMDQDGNVRACDKKEYAEAKEAYFKVSSASLYAYAESKRLEREQD